MQLNFKQQLRFLALILFIVPGIFQPCRSQNQGDIWYFGDHAGVDFRYGSPVAITNGQTKLYNGHNEGSAVISDAKGNLLFYTDGTTIWNRNHQVMSNGSGLLGNISSTQSAIIVPDPSNPHRYFYVFTVGSGFCCNGSIHDGLRYSKVDMCGDGRNGEVMAGQKNIMLLDSVAEKLR
jgi:large repetitive protein